MGRLMGISLTQLKEKAAELLCFFERGQRRGAGYVLVDPDGNKPLGDDYTASLRDIERWLSDRASSADALDGAPDDIDDGEIVADKPEHKLAHVAPPTPQQIHDALQGHENADAIRAVLKPAPLPTWTESKWDRDRRNSAIMGPREGWRSDLLMSEEEKAAKTARAQAAMAEVDPIEAAKAASYPKFSRRDYGDKVSVDDLAFEEKRRQNNVRRRAERQFSQTNRSHDVEFQEIDGEICVEPWRWRDNDDEDFIPPPESHDPAPKAAAHVNVTLKPSRLSRKELLRRREEAKRSSAVDQIAGEIRTLMSKPPTQKRDAALGALLAKAKGQVGRGAFNHFCAEALSISRANAYRLMKAAA
jgi:hypothetical protein